MIRDAYNFDCYRWSIENVGLDLLTHSESFRQWRSATDEKPFHSHVYYELLFASADDSAEFFLEDRQVTLNHNAFVIVSPYLTHRAMPGRGGELFSLGFLFRPNHRKTPAGQDLYRLFCEVFPGSGCIVGKGDETLAGLCRQLKRYSGAQNSLDEGSLVAAFLLVLFHVMGLVRAGSGETLLPLPGPSCPRSGRPGQDARIPSDIASQINNILSESFMTDVTPEELSARYYISARQINRYISKQYGQTFMQRKHELRMDYAQKLLLESDDTIREISEKVGFHSLNSFYSAFKTRFGQTPHSYRTGRGRKGLKAPPGKA